VTLIEVRQIVPDDIRHQQANKNRMNEITDIGLLRLARIDTNLWPSKQLHTGRASRSKLGYFLLKRQCELAQRTCCTANIPPTKLSKSQPSATA